MKRSNATMIAVMALGTWAAASSAVAQDVDAARGKAAVERLCVACHAIDGNSIVPIFPKVSGLHYEYTVKQLEEYASGKRPNVVMQPLVAGMSDQERRDVAAYFAQQTVAPGEVTDASVLEQGKALFHQGNWDKGVPACASCHGSEGLGNVNYPHLAGQNTGYVDQQLKLFASGERNNDKGLMQNIAGRLTEAEIHAVTQYIASMR